MAIESFKFRKKGSVRKITVNDAYRIIAVKGRDKIVSRVLNCPHVAGSDVSGGADKYKILHFTQIFLKLI